MVPSFLSVDIDYWNYFNHPHAPGTTIIPDYNIASQHLKAYLIRLVRFAKINNLPITAIMNHQQMLPLVAKSGAQELINVDSHSDLCFENVDSLACGTWVTYVPWRKNGSYHWIHGNSATNGCSEGGELFQRGQRVSVKKIDRTGWKKVSHQKIKPINLPGPQSLIPRCVGISVCMSPAYACDNFVDTFREWVNEFNVPYKKGLTKENHMRLKQPPFKNKIS